MKPQLAALSSPDGLGLIALVADFAYDSLESTGLVARNLDPPMTVSVQLLWLSDATDGTKSATSYLRTIAQG